MRDGNVGRRNFLSLAASASLFPLLRRNHLSAAVNKKRERLACNSWPFRGYFDTPQMHEFRDTKYALLTQADFPQFLADHFEIHNVEFLPQHFPDTKPSTIESVKAGLKKAGSRCCNLMGLDFTPGVFAPGFSKQILQEGERWLDVAASLGSPSITVGLSGNEAVDPAIAAENLTLFVTTAKRRGIKILFHNDNLRRESAETLVAVIGKLGNDRAGTCPDFGNFATKSVAFALNQLRQLAPYASSICHSKDGIAEHGNFYRDDFPASMRVMHDSGFKGVYSLEFEGLGEPLEGVNKLLAVTEEYLW